MIKKEIILNDRKWEFILQDEKSYTGEDLYIIKYSEYFKSCDTWRFVSQSDRNTLEVVKIIQNDIESMGE